MGTFRERINPFMYKIVSTYSHSYRNLIEIMEERGILITHTTIMRWIYNYSPILEQRIRKLIN
jgi:transposase-like protein